MGGPPPKGAATDVTLENALGGLATHPAGRAAPPSKFSKWQMPECVAEGEGV